MTRARRLSLGLGACATLGLGALALAQIEGRDRGVPPVDSSANLEVGGVEVDVAAKTAEAARSFGWRLAQRRAWRLLWARANGQPADAAPALPDGRLDGIVAGISIEEEQVGPTRYIARLAVLFDRSRAGDLLGGRGLGPRSAPMLVIPVMWSGGAGQSFEKRTEWQKAWARFRSGGSAIDYVRPYGSGIDPLLLNVAQVGRRGRAGWRRILQQYGASDVLVPIVAIERQWPGGPVRLRFRALHGVDGEEVARFDLVAATSDQLPRTLDEGVRRMDAALADALRSGGLIADPLLEEPAAPEPTLPEEAPLEQSTSDVLAAPAPGEAAAAPAPVQSLSVQVDTPDAAAETAAEAALRRVPGVRAVDAASLALGGVSVLRVTFAGDATALREAMAARGLAAEEAGGVIRLRAQ